MDIIDDIFDEIVGGEEESNQLIDRLNKHLPSCVFQLITNNGSAVSSGNELSIPVEIRDRLVDKAKKQESITSIEYPAGFMVHALPVKELDSILIFNAPEQEKKAILTDYCSTAVQLCIELYFLHGTFSEEKKLKEMQEKQINRKTTVLEKKYQKILEDNQKTNIELQEYIVLQQKILDTAATAIYTTDPEKVITDVNQEFCILTGFAKTEIIGKKDDILSVRPCAYSDKFIAKQDNKKWCFMYAKDGGELIIIKKEDIIRDRFGALTGTVGSFVDVTDLVRASEAAETANIAKRDFLAKMSHEMRTPLNGIVGMTELAMDTDIDDNQKDILDTISRESDSLLILINDILDFSKIEAGKLELEYIPFDLRTVVENMAHIIALKAEQKGLEFISFVSPDISPFLTGDPTRLRQIILNFESNALKFTTKGEIFFNAELEEDFDDRVRIRFSVKDTGIGIPKDKITKIFESFIQADDSTTREYGGTGLGTTIAKQLVEQMGGEIGVVSEVGKGSTFWFTMEFSKQTDYELASVEQTLNLTGKRVMLVDDNSTNRIILIAYLKFFGCVPVEASGGSEALAVLNESVSSNLHFDLIILDVQMPKMSGFDVVRELKKLDVLKDIPIIILTSMGMRGDSKVCRDMGVNGYLTKPVKRDEMRKAIVSVLCALPDDNLQQKPELITRHTIAEENRKNYQILIVDDYPTNQKVAYRHITGAGYQVDIADNGQKAVAAYKRKQYDLIMMDMQMPIMDGYEATSRIREHEKELASVTGGPVTLIPIVAMTANTIKGAKEKCIEAGIDDYISKPMRRNDLLAIVAKWIKSKNEGIKGRIKETVEEIDLSPSKNDINANAPINYEKALDEYEGDKEFLMELLNGFIEKVTDQIEILGRAISEGDAEVVRNESHSIKGGSGILTANNLSDLAFQLEKIGQSGDIKGGAEALEGLKKEFNRLKVYVKEIK